VGSTWLFAADASGGRLFSDSIIPLRRYRANRKPLSIIEVIRVSAWCSTSILELSHYIVCSIHMPSVDVYIVTVIDENTTGVFHTATISRLEF
jgi:hypothetical protein